MKFQSTMGNDAPRKKNRGERRNLTYTSYSEGLDAFRCFFKQQQKQHQRQQLEKRREKDKVIIIIINDTLARSLEPVVTECKEHTIRTQTQVVASRIPKVIKRTHEGEANFTT